MSINEPYWRDTDPEVIDRALEELQKCEDPSKLMSALREDVPSVYFSLYESFLRERASTDSNAFHEYCFRNDDGTFRYQPQLHREWNMIWDMGPSRFLIEAPREHSKTTQASQRVIYELGRNTNLRIKVVSAGDDIAGAILGSVAENLEKNTYIHQVFPDLIPDKSRGWTQHKLFVRRSMVGLKDPSVECLSVLSTATGGRADIILFDDIVDQRNTIQQPAMRPMIRSSFFDVWLNILEPDGKAWILGTRWHEDDLYGELEGLCEKPGSGWVLWRKPCIIRVQKEVKEDSTEESKKIYSKIPLWPERFTLDILQTRKNELPASSWARQWMLKIVSEEEGGFIPPVWVEDARLSDIPDYWPKFVGVDLASSLSKRGAYTVFFVAARSPEGHRLPMEIIRGRYKWNEICEILLKLFFKYRPHQIRVENNVFQRAVEQHFKDKYRHIPLVGHTTGANKADGNVGLPSLQSELEKRLWRCWMPEPSLAENSVWLTWVDELLSYPSGKFSDTVMACWFCQSAIREYEGVGKARIRLLSTENTESLMSARDEVERSMYDSLDQSIPIDDVEVQQAIIDIEQTVNAQEKNTELSQQILHLCEFMATTQSNIQIDVAAGIVGVTTTKVIEVLQDSKKFKYTSGNQKFMFVDGTEIGVN